MNMKGQHLIIDAYDCPSGILNDAELLKELLTKAVIDLKMEILSTHFHSFSPQGVTGVIGLSTSHVSIHTWPEHGYVALDLYTCGEQDLWPVLREMLVKMQAARASVCEMCRGEEPGKTPVTKTIHLTEANSAQMITAETNKTIQLQEGRGNEWDMKQLKGLLAGKHTVLYEGTSAFQNVLLVEARDLRLYLDQELQFSSIDERLYHEALVHPAMEMAASRERVLILGGGDGLALREILKYPTVKHVDLVDIDPFMITISKTEPSLVEQNERSLHDSRVHVHVEDARAFISENLEPYDVIIIDFPDPVDPVIGSLYTKELYSRVAAHLAEDGVIVCQSNSPEDAPIVFWSIAKTMEHAGLHTYAYNIIVPSFGLWGFHLASRKKLAKDLPNISVPHQALPSDIKTLFQISPTIAAARKKAIVNTLDNLQLHELYQKEIEEWS